MDRKDGPAWTPGPWEAGILQQSVTGGWGRYVWDVGTDGKRVAEVMEAADAHLIAAAPDLYGALQYLASETDPNIDEDYNPHSAPLAKARAALARARGEADG